MGLFPQKKKITWVSVNKIYQKNWEKRKYFVQITKSNDIDKHLFTSSSNRSFKAGGIPSIKIHFCKKLDQ